MIRYRNQFAAVRRTYQMEVQQCDEQWYKMIAQFRREELLETLDQVKIKEVEALKFEY